MSKILQVLNFRAAWKSSQKFRWIFVIVLTHRSSSKVKNSFFNYSIYYYPVIFLLPLLNN